MKMMITLSNSTSLLTRPNFNLLVHLVLLASVAMKAFGQTDWIKYSGNPIIDVGPPGVWDDTHVLVDQVILNGSSYHMWYTGRDGTNWRIGYASSLDGITWTKHPGNPVLDVGDLGDWDNVGVCAGYVIFDGSTYHMWYTGIGINNARKIGYATAPNETSWTKHPGNPVLDRGVSGTWDQTVVEWVSVVLDGFSYHMWYTGRSGGTTRIGYASSQDAIAWSKHPGNPILDIGPFGSFDRNSVGFPRVLFEGSTYHMWYTGDDGARSRTGYATAQDATTWTKHAGNPVLDVGPFGAWDDGSAASGAVLFDEITYQMWYTGDDEFTGRIGYATSTITGIPEINRTIPENYSLSQNYPNPFNPATKIQYTLPNSAGVIMNVFDLLGREMAVLVNEEKQPGRYEVEWQPASISSGVYFYRLSVLPLADFAELKMRQAAGDAISGSSGRDGQAGDSLRGSGRWFVEMKKLVFLK